MIHKMTAQGLNRFTQILITTLCLSNFRHVNSLLQTSGEQSFRSDQGANQRSCSIQEFDECLSLIKSVTQSDELAFATTRHELDSACRKLQNGVRCADSHMQRCVSKGQRRLFEEVVRGTRDVISKLCTPGKMQRDYLRFSGCYKNVSKSEEKCAGALRAFQSMDSAPKEEGESVDRPPRKEDVDQGLKKFCCAFSQAYNCQVFHLRIDCGTDAVEFFEKNLEEMSGSLIHEHCSSFTYDRHCYDPEGPMSGAVSVRTMTSLTTLIVIMITSPLISIYMLYLLNK